MKRSTLFMLLLVMLVTSATARAQETTKEQKVDVSQLPAAVAQALKINCSNCVIDKATREVEKGVIIYDFEFKHGQGEMDVTEDGFVVSRETIVKIDDIPAQVREAIRTGAASGRVAQVLKEEVRAELTDGKVNMLDKPKYFYEADLVNGNQVAEIVVSPEGQVIEPPAWRKRGTKEP